MSSHATSSPVERRYAAPSSVAASSPLASTRACTRGLTSPISLTPAMTCASAAKRSSNIAGVDAELARERVVLRADLGELVVGIAAGDGRIEQRDQRIRDADERRVNDDGANALGEPLANEPRDDRPVLRRGDAAPAELQHDPRRVGIRRIDGLARAEHWL